MIGGAVNFTLLLALRIFILTPEASHIKAFRQFSGNYDSSMKIKSYAKYTPVLFQDDWIDASLYSYYAQTLNSGNLNSAFYRRNQFDLIDADETFTNQSVIVLTRDSLQFANASKINTGRSILYAKTFENFHSYYNLKMRIQSSNLSTDKQEFTVVLENPYEESIIIGDQPSTKACFQLCTRINKRWTVLSECPVSSMTLPSETSVKTQAVFTVNSSTLKGRDVFLTFKIGELNPVPSKCRVNQ